ncbi:type II toxin-antitoxin system Phd/YefM family antitoxin [Duganella radicis]|nr:type II toxin-antitoxin system prevent-host-death family antitoxin [Duganella radicis]
MTSLEAQNHFGEMIDTSQREPVLITRRGRPVSVVISPNGDAKEALFQFMKVVRELAPLHGKEASNALADVLSRIGHQAKAEGLTEADITRLVNDTK